MTTTKYKTMLSDTHTTEQTNPLLKELQRHAPMSFYEYMNLALYHPQYGYYQSELPKFGTQGDFITAPLLSPIFAYCLANQCQTVLESMGEGDILEFGAGTGQLALDLLTRLNHLSCLPQYFYILELSTSLKAQQQKLLKSKIPELYNRIIWLDTLPQDFKGVMIGNEVLDAIPCHRFKFENNQVLEQFVTVEKDQLRSYFATPKSKELTTAVIALSLNTQPYESELSLAVSAWIKTVADVLQQGALILLDYGFPQVEFYHPERCQGTLMCHYAHRSHPDPLVNPGQRDITSHVDFTRVAHAGQTHGLNLAGFSTQGAFLIGCGLSELMTEMQQHLTSIAWYNCTQAVKCLTLPHEMGELFKAIAFTKSFDVPLMGFSFQDQRPRLLRTCSKFASL